MYKAISIKDKTEVIGDHTVINGYDYIIPRDQTEDPVRVYADSLEWVSDPSDIEQIGKGCFIGAIIVVIGVIIGAILSYLL